MIEHQHHLASIERLLREGHDEWEVDRTIRQAVRRERMGRVRRRLGLRRL